ncbi:MAG: putative O-glycosylation ligase, exosortase A system-associated [Candidatus Accumulibacter sp.]|nr:putative O-glycosylation ligase, exosortase A system-associated [Accumulibacter sp.]
MRDLMIAGAVLLLFAFSLRSIYSAYLLWGWFGLIAVQDYLYGLMRGVPYVMVFATITLFLLLIGKDREMASYKINGASVIMILYGAHCFMAALFAYSWLDRNWELCTNVLKTLLFCLIMPMVITRRYRFHALLVMIVIGTSFHGLVEGLKFLVSGGGHKTLGVAKFGDNNHFALVLVMSMPLLLYLFQYSKYNIARICFGGVFFITCLAVVATASRGALVSLLAICAWLILNSRRKMVYILIALMAGGLIVSLAPDSWTERMNTIENAGEDSSFMGRVIAWKRASAIALDHPVFGGGFHAGQDHLLFLQYNFNDGLLGFVSTPGGTYAAASHSIYFEVLGDLGFVGLFWFLFLMFYSFWLRGRIQVAAKKLGKQGNWARDCSDMLSASMIAYLVGGALLSAAYFELSYIIVMIMQVLLLLVKKELSPISGIGASDIGQIHYPGLSGHGGRY